MLLSLNRIRNIRPFKGIQQCSPGSLDTHTPHDCCKLSGRHCRTRTGLHHQSLMRSRTLLSPLLCSDGRVYQQRPEYLIGRRAHPWDLICTGVHLVYAVYDNLHIMLDLHPASEPFFFFLLFFFSPPPESRRPLWRPAIVCRHCSKDQCVSR